MMFTVNRLKLTFNAILFVDFYSTWYSIRRSGVPRTSSHSFGGVFLTFSVIPRSPSLPDGLALGPISSIPVRRQLPLYTHRGLHSDQKQSLSLAAPSQPSKHLVSSISFGLSAMHQRSDDESIANYLSVKFHPDLIKIIGY
jgi:hypothetical protein